jgi:IS30 family transposase
MQGLRKPKGHIERRGRGSFCLTIHERENIFPDMAKEFGHLEGDTIVGKNHRSRVITLAENLYKPIIALKLTGTDATAVAKRLGTWLSSLPKHIIRSITFDRGKDFSQWKRLCNKHDIYIFFADAGTPSQRPLNEHANGLLRRDGLPKGTYFNLWSEQNIQAVADFCNNIPRKSLDYKSPIEMLNTWISGQLQIF